jgi:hypothetical protein
MTRESDRIPVPTNGHEPAERQRTPRAVMEVPALAPATLLRSVTPPDPVPTVTSPEPATPVTPAKVAVAFSVVAGIVLLVLGSRRGRGKG